MEFAINCYRYHTPAGMDMVKEVQGEDRLNLELQCIKQALVKQFDLAQAPLFRVVLVEVEKEALPRVLFLDMHHITVDGTSQSILEKEFISLSRGEKPAPLRLQYKDFACWQNREEQRKLLTRQEQYWLSVFSDELPVLTLPTDYPRPLMQRFEGNTLSFLLNPQETAALKDAAKEADATLYMSLLAVYTILLYKLAGQEDIIVGTPIAARRHADLEAIIGMFVNTLAIRNYPSPGKTFHCYLKEVKERALAAFENQEYQFEDLVGKVSVRRDTSRNPIFDVMLNLLNQEDYSGEIPGKADREEDKYEHQTGTSKFDLNLTAVDLGKHLFFTLEYSTSLFKPGTIERFTGYFRKIFNTLSLNRKITLAGIDIISKEEKERILQMSLGKEEVCDDNLTIHQLFKRQAVRTPDLIAAVFHEINFSYKELDDRSNRLAGLLIQKGVKPDTIVGLKIERSIEMLIGMLAIMKAGGAYLPIDTQYPQERIKYMLKDSNVGVLVTTPKPQVKIKAEVKLINLPYAIKPSPSTSTCQVSHTNLAYIIYTSGSTGNPKGVMLEHRNLVNLMRFHHKYTNIDCSKVLQFATICFDASFHEIFSALLYGGTIYLIDKETRGNIFELFHVIRRHQISTVFLPMSFLKVIFSQDEYINALPRCVRHIQTAGEQVVVSKKFRTYLKTNHIWLHNHYGPSETHVVTAASMEPPGQIPELPPIGQPVLNTAIYIVDKAMHLVPVAVAGELLIGGIQVGRGYLNNPELTAQRFCLRRPGGSFCKNRPLDPHKNFSLEGLHKDYMQSCNHAAMQPCSHETMPLSPNHSSQYPITPSPHHPIYHTGDLARWLSEGNIEFLGRIDSQVKIRGFRVELGEIETRLLNHPEIKESVVTLRVDENKDKYLCAYIVPGKKTRISGLRQYLAKSLPDYMVPAYFVFIEKIPVTPNGKVDYSALPEPEVKTGDRYAAPRNETEKKLQEIWSEVLGSNAGIDDNFFKLGGHSLKATVMAAKIHKKINAKVTLAEIFRTPTIRGLAAYIRPSDKDRYASIEMVEEKEYYALSSAQKRIYILQQLEPHSTVYNLPEFIPLSDNFNLEKIEKTFKKLIQRHESLRTSFHMIENEPVQKIYDTVQFEIKYYQVEVKVKVEEERSTRSEGTRGLAPLPEESHPPSIIRHRNISSEFIRPFDLSQAPLLRVGLTHQRTLWVDMHHIISDGVSHEILIKDFMGLDGNHDLPRLRIRYKDFSEWQNSEPVKKKLIEQETYWLKELEDKPPVLQLPSDYPRPAIQRFEGDIMDFELEKDLTEALKKLALAEKTTVFMVLLTLFNVLLARLSGHEDIIVGIPAAGRRHADLEKVIGMFVNTLAIRSRPIGEKRFKDFLAEVKTGTLLAFENQEYPFDNLVEKVEANRDTSRNPLFDVMFNWQTHPGLPGEINAQSSNENRNHTSKFDLMLHAREIADRLLFTFEYSTRLFKRETLERFVNYFISIISGVLSSPGKKLMELEVISEAEKKQLLYEFNDTQTDYPSEMTIHELFEEQVKRTPDSAAVVDLKHKAESAAQLQITYRELDKQSGQLAQVLMEKGVGPDSIVGIMVQRSVEMITGILGILKAGGAYLPIEADYPEARIKYMLKDSGAKILLTNLSGAHHFHHSSFLTHHSSHLAYVIYTSGTTGRPNAVMVEHRNVVRLVKNTNYITFKPNDRILQTGILAFDASTFEIWGALLNGLQLFITGLDIILNPVILQETIQNYCITTAWMTSPLFNRLCDENAGIFSGLRNLLVGGDVLSVPHINKIKTMYPHLRVINGYGPTENTTFSTTFSIEKEFKNSIPIGVPISNTTTYIVDRYQRLQPPGVCGELWLGGDSVSRGYLNNPELTVESFCLRQPGVLFSRKPPREASGRPRKSFLLEKNHIQSCSHASMQYHSHYPIAPLPHSPNYRTGDLAQWLSDGNIRFLGRIDSQVKIRGFRIELREIENPLRNHPAVSEAIVLAAADETNEKYLCAYLVAKRKAQGAECTIADLKKYLSGSLPDYMIPSIFVFIDNIPLTPNGKVDHKALPAPGVKTRDRSEAPRNETDMKLKEIWAEVLGINVGIDDNFFEVGGHSLKAVVLAAKIHKKLSIKVPLAGIFKAPTIRELAGYIQGIGKEKYASIEPVEKKEYHALSSAQKRIYVLQQMDRQSTVYNIPGVIPLWDEAEVKQLAKTFKKLIQRHDSLRTSFHMIENEPVQKIHDAVEFEIKYYQVEVKVKVEEERSPRSEGTRGLAPLPLESATRSPQPAARSRSYKFFYPTL